MRCRSIWNSGLIMARTRTSGSTPVSRSSALSASAALPVAAPALAAAVRRTTRGQRVRALLLVAPLLALLLLSFCLPIGILLSRAIYDPATHDALPRTAAALAASPDDGVPDD